MGDVLHFLVLRAQGRIREHRYRKSWKAVLYMLEDAAAIPSQNQPCEFSGEPRATFLMDFSPSKLRVASTHGDHTVRVSDVRTGKCTHILTGHPRTPWCLAFSPTSDDILASGCLAGEIRIWDLMGGGSEVLRNPCRGQVVTSMAFHPSGQVLAFATMNYIYFWDWSKETPFAFTQTSHESERIRWLKFDSYGHYLYTGIGNLTSFPRDIFSTEMEFSDGLDDTLQTEEMRNLQTSSRVRYQRLLERFVSFRRNRHRYRNESFLHRLDEFNTSNNPARLWPQVDDEDQNILLETNLNRSFLSNAANVDANSWDDSRNGRRSADIVRLGELPARQRWGRYEPSFFSRSNGSNNSSLQANNGSYRFSDNSVGSSGSQNYNSASSRMSDNSNQDHQSSGPSRRINLTGMEEPEAFFSSSGLSNLSPRSTSRRTNVAATSEVLDTDEFTILPIDQGRGPRFRRLSGDYIPPAPLHCDSSESHPDFLYQRDELQALINRYVNRPTEGGSASSAISTLASLVPSQSNQSFISSAASTANCIESNANSFSVPPLAEAALAEPLSVQPSIGAHLSTAASCSSSHLQLYSHGSIGLQQANADSTSSSEHDLCREEGRSMANDASEDHNALSTNGHHLSNIRSDGCEDSSVSLSGTSNSQIRSNTHDDCNVISACSRNAGATVQNISRLRPHITGVDEASSHNSSLAPYDAAPSAAVIPDAYCDAAPSAAVFPDASSSSSLMKQQTTSLNKADISNNNISLTGGFGTHSWINRHTANSFLGHQEKHHQRRGKLVFTDKPSNSQESRNNNPLYRSVAAIRKLARTDHSGANKRFCEFSSRHAHSTHSTYNDGTSRNTENSLHRQSSQRMSYFRPRCTNPLINNLETTFTDVLRSEYNLFHSRPTSSERSENSERNSQLTRSLEHPDIRSRFPVMSANTETVQRSGSTIMQNNGILSRTQRPGHLISILRQEAAPRPQHSSTHQNGIHVSFHLGQNQSRRILQQTYRNNWNPYEGFELRHHLSAFNDRLTPRPVADQTSQTLGAMNLPASNDQGTDVVGLEDTSTNFMQVGRDLESTLNSLGSCIGCNNGTDQGCAFPHSNHNHTSIILSSLLDNDREDGSAAQDSRSGLESERFQRIQNFVRSVRAYLTEYGESFLQGGAQGMFGESSYVVGSQVNTTDVESENVVGSQVNTTGVESENVVGSQVNIAGVESENVVDSQVNTTSGISDRRGIDDQCLAIDLRDVNSSSQPIAERVVDNETKNELLLASSAEMNSWSPEISSFSSTTSFNLVAASNSSTTDSQCSDQSAFYSRNSYVSRASNNASDPVFSVPASSASRALQLLPSTSLSLTGSDRFQSTTSVFSNSTSMPSHSTYRSIFGSHGPDNPTMFHPYASALRHSRSPLRYRQHSSRNLQNNFTEPSESDRVSNMSANNFEDSQLHNSTESRSQQDSMAARLSHLNDSDQPSAFSIFSNVNRARERQRPMARTKYSLFNPVSINSDSASSCHLPSIGHLSQPSSPSSTPPSRAPNLYNRAPSFESEHLHEPRGAISGDVQDNERNLAWRTPNASLVNQAAVTEYLERRVIELDRRLSDLEQNYNSRLRELQVECQLGRSAHSTHSASRSTRSRGVNMDPYQISRDSTLFSRTDAAAQPIETAATASSSESTQTQSVPFRQLLECLRRQDPNPPPRVSEADLPTSVTITQSREDEDANGAGPSLRCTRPWHALRQIYLHPDYSSSSILDDAINHDVSSIGGPYSNPYDIGITSNLVVQTHRIQQWDITKITVPNLSDASANIVVRHCKLHNDASCNLSQDGTLLVTIVPRHRRFSDSNIVALFSLKKQSFAQCLYTKSFGPDALSVSISPLNRYVLVGLASRRTIFVTTAQRVGQVFRLVKEKAGESSMKHYKDIYHIYDEDRGNHVSVNSARWLPGVGEGLVYGTNRGDLHFIRAGSRKVHGHDASCDREEFTESRRRAVARNSIGTQTTTVSIRRSASTQTFNNAQVREERMNTDHDEEISAQSDS